MNIMLGEKQNYNISIGNNTNNSIDNNKKGDKGKVAKSQDNHTFYMGNINNQANNQKPSRAEEIKERFKNKAADIINKQFKKEAEFTNNLKDMEEEVKRLDQEEEEKTKVCNQLKSDKQALLEEYGIDPEGEEYKRIGELKSALANGDIEKIEEMGGIKDYEANLIDIENNISSFEDEIKKTHNMSAGIAQGITWSKIEKLKSHDMEDAQKAADDVLEQGNKQFMGQLVNEAVEKKENEIKEEKEKAEEKKEEKVEEEKKQQAAEEKRAQENQVPAKEVQGAAAQEKAQTAQQENVNQIAEDISDQAQVDSNEVKAKVLKVAQENMIVNEDVLGILINETV